MNKNKSNKVTFKTQDVIIQLLTQFFKIRLDIYKLIDKSPNDTYKPKQIYGVCKGFPKSLQRNKNRYNQLLLSQQLKNLLDYFLNNKITITSFRKNSLTKRDGKYKSYQLFLIFKKFADIMSSRIRASLSGNLQELANNKENYKIFYLINEFQFLSNQLQSWAKKQDKNIKRNNSNQSVQFIYPDANTHRKTLATTTDASKNLSKYQKSQTIEEFNQRISEYCLLRANTAKIQKKQLKLSMRCPSAASILKNQSYKQPLFEPKKPVIKYKHKSTDFEQKPHQNFQFPENNAIFQSRFKQNKLLSSKQRKISILNKSIKQQDDVLRIKSSKKFLNQNQKLKKTGIAALKRKKQVKVNIQSNEEISSSKNGQSHIGQSQCQILDPEIIETRERKPTIMSFKQTKMPSRPNINSQSSLSNNSLQSSFWQNQQNTVYIKERQIYKKARRSGKVMVKNHDQLKDVYMINAPKVKENNFTRRRKAMLSTHNEELTQIQNIVNAEKQLKTKKQLQYDQNVLLVISDALKTRSAQKSNKQNDKNITDANNKKTFNVLFNQMNLFLKDYFIGKPIQSVDSVFFQQQKRIKCFQDHNIRQKMRQLINNNGNANIFQIPSTEACNKDQIYNQIHRRLTFNSDSQWIRNMYTSKLSLIQKQL